MIDNDKISIPKTQDETIILNCKEKNENTKLVYSFQAVWTWRKIVYNLYTPKFKYKKILYKRILLEVNVHYFIFAYLIFIKTHGFDCLPVLIQEMAMKS